jgi:hypothetical protein
MKKNMNRRKSNGYWERLILVGLRTHLRKTQPFLERATPKDHTSEKRKAA